MKIVDVIVTADESSGSAFDQVEYVQMDGNGGVEIVIGYQINNQVLRAVNVYTFKQGQAEQLFSSNYTKFLTVDMDADFNNELFILRPGPSEESSGIAEIYGVTNGVVERSNEVQMSQPAKLLSLRESTMFRRLGSAPLGSERNVLLPIIIVCPVVSSLKRFRSLGNQ